MADKYVLPGSHTGISQRDCKRMVDLLLWCVRGVDSMTVAEGNNGVVGTQGDASVANLQVFLDTFVCQANSNKTDYFFCTSFLIPPRYCSVRLCDAWAERKLTPCSLWLLVEAFDEPWKAQYGGVEPYWGLFDSDRNLKSGLTIPTCSHT